VTVGVCEVDDGADEEDELSLEEPVVEDDESSREEPVVEEDDAPVSVEVPLLVESVEEALVVVAVCVWPVDAQARPLRARAAAAVSATVQRRTARIRRSPRSRLPGR
jgi:hypothetical protein